MTKKENYIWDLGANQSPILEPHSQVKHEILADYLKRYICTLYGTSALRGNERNPKLTIVDGFAGGGVYQGDKWGSPFVLLHAVREAEFEINQNGRNSVEIDANFFFVEKYRSSLEYLRYSLERNGYTSDLEKTIFLRHGDFNVYAASIIEHIQKRSPINGGRAIIFLDQEGYTGVKPEVLRSIIQRLPKAEIIINIAITWLIDFISENDKFISSINGMGLNQYLNIRELIEIKEQKSENWRLIVESKLSTALKQATGARFFTPFFIEPQEHHRGYWLLHLAPHPRARDVMLGIHWNRGNDFRHYGGLGMDCLSYKPETSYSLFSFDKDFRQQNVATLANDIPRMVADQYPEGVTVEQIIQLKCNDTVANSNIFKESILLCWEQNGLDVKGKKGGDKTSRTIDDKDILLPKRQFILL